MANIVKTSLQPFHFSAFEIIESRNDFGANMMDDFIFFNQLCHPFGMSLRIVIDAAACVDGRSDAFDQIKDVSRQIIALTSCSDRTAGCVSHDDHQGRFQMLDGIFNGAKDFLIHNVARVTDDKEVAEFLVEDDFRCHTAVGAAQHHGEGMLACGEFLP